MIPYASGPGWELWHGDALALLRSLRVASVDFIFTDPPYGHNNNDGDLMGSRARAKLPNARYATDAVAIANDGPEANDLFRAALPEFRRLLKPGCCCCCCCGGGGPDPQFARWSLWMDEHLGFKQMVVWDKGWGLGWHYRRCYETVLVAQKPGARCAWYDETRAVRNIIRHREIPRRVATADTHPTPKPVALAEHFIRLHTRPGDLVLDPFCGGGSTMEAALNLGRRFIGCDLDPRWLDMSARRLASALPEALAA